MTNKKLPHNIVYDEMCRQCQCENYIEWEHEYELVDWNRNHQSIMICVSCQLVGQSYNIDEYPEECPHKVELDRYVELETVRIEKALYELEKRDVWKKLNKV